MREWVSCITGIISSNVKGRFSCGAETTRPAGRTPHLVEYLLDRQLDVGPTALATQEAYVFEAHQRFEDLTRLDKDEGASCFLAHTST
jgi:hypothetical protein